VTAAMIIIVPRSWAFVLLFVFLGRQGAAAEASPTLRTSPSRHP
jgi:hypothetical protein